MGTAKRTISGNQRLPMADKIAYGFGDLANNCVWAVIVTFLMSFYTDTLLIPAGSVGLLMVVSRIWDAINDPIIGTMADNCQTRWGKYKPWIIFGCVPLAVVYVLTFTGHPEWSMKSQIIYAWVTYCAMVLVYTIVNIPWGALNAVMTPDIDDRASLTSVKLFFSFGTNAVMTITVLPLVAFLGKGDDITGWKYTTIILGAVAVVFYLICGIKCKEVVHQPKSQKTVSLFGKIEGDFA